MPTMCLRFNKYFGFNFELKKMFFPAVNDWPWAAKLSALNASQKR